MSVSDVDNKVQEQGNGAKVAYTFSYKVFATTDVKVYIVNRTTDEQTLQTVTTDYTITLTNDGDSGGTVTYNTAPTTSEDSLIIRDLALSQDTSFPTESNFPETSVENGLDKLTMITQDLEEEIDRTVKVQSGASNQDVSLPTTDSGKAILWDATGGLKNSTVDIDSLVPATGAASKIWDADNDTMIQTEEAADEDKIRFDTGGTERVVIDSSGLTINSGGLVFPSGVTFANLFTDFIKGCQIYRVDGTNIGLAAGIAMIQGELVNVASAITDITYTVPDAADWLDVWLDQDGTAASADSGTTPGQSSDPGTGRMIGSIFYGGSTAKISKTIQYRDGSISGWSFIEGDSTIQIEETVTHGKTLSFVNAPLLTLIGRQASTSPTTQTFASVHNQAAKLTSYNHQPTVFSTALYSETGLTYSTSQYYGYTWKIDAPYT